MSATIREPIVPQDVRKRRSEHAAVAEYEINDAPELNLRQEKRNAFINKIAKEGSRIAELFEDADRKRAELIQADTLTRRKRAVIHTDILHFKSRTPWDNACRFLRKRYSLESACIDQDGRVFVFRKLKWSEGLAGNVRLVPIERFRSVAYNRYAVLNDELEGLLDRMKAIR